MAEIFVWAGRTLAKILSLLLGWGIEWDFGRMGGMEINISKLLSWGCMALLLTRRPLLKLLCQGKGWRIEEFEMFVLFGNLMIGRWRKGCIFFVSWEPIPLQWMLEIGWDGSWSLMGFLTSGRIITSCGIPLQLSFFGKVYGELRSLDVFLSSSGV